MNLLEKINKCKSDIEIDNLVNEELKKIHHNLKKLSGLGLVDAISDKYIYRGFIPSEINYKNSNTVIIYGIDITLVFYKFAHFIKKHKIKNNVGLIHWLEYFITKYINKNQDINYNAIFCNKIGVKEGKKRNSKKVINIAKSIFAEELLAFVGMDTYLCLGSFDNGEQTECAFNIVKRETDYILLDYDMPVHSYNYNKAYINAYPFIGEITYQEIDDFIHGSELKTFKDYNIIDGKTIKYNGERSYTTKRYKESIKNNK